VTLEVRRYGSGDASAWDDLVARSSSGHFLFRRAYLEYHGDRLEDHSLLVFEGPKLVAALPAHMDGTRLISHGGLTFGGLITASALSSRRRLAAFDAICGYLRERGVQSLLYKAVPHIYQRVPAEDDLFALYRAGAHLVARQLGSAIRLDSRLPYSKGRRADLKVAARSRVNVERSHDFDAFMALQRMVLEVRHGARPVHTTEELKLLESRFPEEIKLHIATIDERLVAGVVTYETEAVARAQYVAVSEEGRAAHALDRIVDDLLHMYAGHKRWFDFGTSMLEGGGLNEPLIRNKESYGARTVVYDHYLLDVASDQSRMP
jgi:Acetyltransferase (GNAT) domain